MRSQVRRKKAESERERVTERPRGSGKRYRLWERGREREIEIGDVKGEVGQQTPRCHGNGDIRVSVY